MYWVYIYKLSSLNLKAESLLVIALAHQFNGPGLIPYNAGFYLDTNLLDFFISPLFELLG